MNFERDLEAFAYTTFAMTAISPEQLDDVQLVKLALEDVEYFEPLMARYERQLLRYVLRISSFSEAEAEEIVQEVFLKTWKNLRDFDGGLKFSSWLYRIAHNETISHFRKHQVRGMDRQLHLDEDLYNSLPSELHLQDEIAKTQRNAVIQNLLQQLPEQYCDVLVLKFFEDRSYEEISDILKKPMGTVATLINRAKQQFKQLAHDYKIAL
ncbi:hypothetical protein COV82_03895 [Candidatus Peregrinibacteria bacterium CG11_big_fil_rev_8_21_14_0_20_46_8]|nr:MAG: hypothetical protein COV82_03895 [Candidatus Peregrinibacteria bacterium CG11_big_fil_rev_8_21_14_0_20_46_8]